MFRKHSLLLLLVCAGPALAQPKLIAIANFGEHPALRAGIDGDREATIAESYRGGIAAARDDGTQRLVAAAVALIVLVLAVGAAIVFRRRILRRRVAAANV